MSNCIKPLRHLDSQDSGFLHIASTTSVKRSVLSMTMRFSYHPDSSPVMQRVQTRIE
jgi:hypothetical protein